MKRSLVLPLVTAVAGFCLGWSVNSGPEPAISKSPPAVTPAPKPPAGISTPPAPAPPVAARPVGVAAAGKPAVLGAELWAKAGASKAAAKLLRLAEVLGLTAAQQADLEQLIAKVQKPARADQPAAPVEPNEVLDLLAARAAALEQGLAALLTPEQSAAFADIRQRERDNRIETTVQRELANLSEVTDLSAAQRATVLAALRQANTSALAAEPAPLALILDSSVLPLGPQAPSAQSIQSLRQLADNTSTGDPLDIQAKRIENQRRLLDARLSLFKDILTPAQFAQYQASVAEQHAIHDAMSTPH